MYAITVVINSAMFQLLYKTESAAREADKALKYDPSAAMGSLSYISVTDDFGQEIHCDRKNLAGYVFETLEKSKLGHVERALHQQKVQMLAQKHAAADPALRMHSQMNGPAVMSPFPPPRNQ